MKTILITQDAVRGLEKVLAKWPDDDSDVSILKTQIKLRDATEAELDIEDNVLPLVKSLTKLLHLPLPARNHPRAHYKFMMEFIYENHTDDLADMENLLWAVNQFKLDLEVDIADFQAKNN